MCYMKSVPPGLIVNHPVSSVNVYINNLCITHLAVQLYLRQLDDAWNQPDVDPSGGRTPRAHVLQHLGCGGK